MKDKRNYTITKEGAGTRIDVFLQNKLEEFSRSWIQKLIVNGEVVINGIKKTKSYKLKAKDNVRVRLLPPPTISLDPEPNLLPKPHIIFEHEAFLAVDKPSGLVVHPAETTPHGTLVNWLLSCYPEIQNVGEESFRPGIVHRLDKETSGLMVVARTQKMFTWLKKEFKARHVDKTYTALVSGSLEEEEGEVTFPVGRAKSDPTKQRAYKNKKTTPANARHAITQWRVVKRYPDFTLIEAHPVTGRMHQIRVHMRALGHPIVGDKKYTTKNAPKLKSLGRMFLHAEKLHFKGPSGETFSFSSPLPLDLKRALKNIAFVVK